MKEKDEALKTAEDLVKSKQTEIETLKALAQKSADQISELEKSLKSKTEELESFNAAEKRARNQALDERSF